MAGELTPLIVMILPHRHLQYFSSLPEVSMSSQCSWIMLLFQECLKGILLEGKDAILSHFTAYKENENGLCLVRLVSFKTEMELIVINPESPPPPPYFLVYNEANEVNKMKLPRKVKEESIHHLTAPPIPHP